MSATPHDPELTALEAALAGLAPAAAALDRDRLLYLAGRASASRRGRLWPAATAVLALLSAGLGVTLAQRPEPAVVERIVERTVVVHVDRPSQAAAAAVPVATPVLAEAVVGVPRPADALWLRDQVLRLGLDALPESAPAREPEPMLTAEPLFGLPPGSLDRSTTLRWKLSQKSGGPT